jgi:hypothetical protein
MWTLLNLFLGAFLETTRRSMLPKTPYGTHLDGLNRPRSEADKEFNFQD